jgi:hypothetical protein
LHESIGVNELRSYNNELILKEEIVKNDKFERE